MKKRYSLSLIEVLISLSLITLLVGSLSFWYRSVTANNAKLEQKTWGLKEERWVDLRLSNILPAIKSHLTSTGEGEIAFLFDRGVWNDPLLSGTILGKLYHDTQRNALCLGIWPHPKQGKIPSETLTLLEDVTSVTFDFYSPPDPFRLKVDPEKVGKSRPAEKWQSSWDLAYEELPAMIQITFTHNEHTCRFVYELPYPICYPSEEDV